MTRWLVTCALSLCACATTQDPNARYGAIKGESLLSLAGTASESRLSIDGAPTVKTTAFTTRVGYGYFLTANHEIGSNLSLQFEDVNVAGSDRTITDWTAVYNYNIRSSSRTWYYLGVDLGFRYTDDEINGVTNATDLLYGVHAGLRNWVTPRIAIFVEPFFLASEVDLEVQKGVPFDQYGILFGLQYAF